jgi:hypothetical protein
VINYIVKYFKPSIEGIETTTAENKISDGFLTNSISAEQKEVETTSTTIAESSTTAAITAGSTTMSKMSSTLLFQSQTPVKS